MYGWLGKHSEADMWNAMVGAVLRYGSEVWFPGVLAARRLEAIQLSFLKKVLRVGPGTRSEFVRGETGSLSWRGRGIRPC